MSETNRGMGRINTRKTEEKRKAIWGKQDDRRVNESAEGCTTKYAGQSQVFFASTGLTNLNHKSEMMGTTVGIAKSRCY